MPELQTEALRHLRGILCGLLETMFQECAKILACLRVLAHVQSPKRQNYSNRNRAPTVMSCAMPCETATGSPVAVPLVIFLVRVISSRNPRGFGEAHLGAESGLTPAAPCGAKGFSSLCSARIQWMV
jgi:hypothetical protein